MTTSVLLAELRSQGVDPAVRDRLKLRGPAARLTPDLVRQVRQHKIALLVDLRSEKEDSTTGDQALALHNRLKCYSLPTGRMPATRVIAERCAARLVLGEDDSPVFEVDDPASILAVLHDIESELIALGGATDPLIEGVAMIQRAFPGTRLVEVRMPPKRFDIDWEEAIFRGKSYSPRPRCSSDKAAERCCTRSDYVNYDPEQIHCRACGRKL